MTATDTKLLRRKNIFHRQLASSCAAFGAGLLVITVLIMVSGDNASERLGLFFSKPFSSWWYLGNMLNTAGLLLFAGIGSAFALKSGSFNLGGEAQIYAPALVTAVILGYGGAATQGQTVSAHPGFILLMAFLCAIFTGALLGFIPGILRARFRISELLSSFLLSAALIPVIDYLIGGPLRYRSGNLLATPTIARVFRITPIVRPSYFNISFFIAILLAILIGLFFKRTGPGYRIRITGTAPEFALFSGFPVQRITTAGMTISGMFHALTGFFAITGTWYMCHSGFSSGMGWSALAIALIARQNLFAVIPVSLLYAWLETASDVATAGVSFSFDSTSIMQAVIFLVISAQTFGEFLQRRKPTNRKPSTTEAKEEVYL